MNEVRWRLGRFEDLVIVYRHRGAPGDVRAVEGRAVREVTRGWLVLERIRGGYSTSIPWHRVVRLELDAHVLWERAPRQP
ncbi:MAG TPA: RNA repair domain-containing protein [Candidatus Thermoplasmatota archaeon]|nr:RNA repair domain-containing protein [Candidatus Thermoplasmatota archaeon]